MEYLTLTLTPTLTPALTLTLTFYLHSALSFFVGWMWITFLRDLTILCTFAVRPYFESGRLTCRTLESGSNLCSDSTGENAVYVTAAVSMFLFSGLLTWAR